MISIPAAPLAVIRSAMAPASSQAASVRAIPPESRRRSAGRVAVFALLLACFAAPSSAQPNLDFLAVGDAGNAADTTGYGAVGSTFEIGRLEFTNAQYVRFLNAVDPDGTNPDSIYNGSMGNDARGGISFTGGNSSGTKYATRSNMADKPVNFVSWFDAARVANWLENGGQTYGTTASGSSAINGGAYTLGGAVGGTAPAPNAGASFRLPTENEWYKAAYYKGGGTTAGYWSFATQSDSAPAAVAATIVGTGTLAAVSPVTTGNSANYLRAADWNGQDGTVTSAGSNGGPSAAGTFDMGGNVWEWNDLTAAASSSRGIRGGSWNSNSSDGISAAGGSSHQSLTATLEANDVGFRLASALPTALTWNATDGTWNAIDPNWVASTIAIYAMPSGASATFSGTSGGTVTLSGSMQPSAVIVSASSGTHTFLTAAGNLITGTGGLSKSGSGTLVLSGSNAYTGGTTLSAGTLRAGHDGALGSGTITLAGGTLASADGSARSLANAVSITADTSFGDATGTGTLTLAGAVNLGGVVRGLTTVSNVTFGGPVSAGGVTKAGPGTLTISGAQGYSGPTTVQAGTLSLSGTLSSSAVTVQAGATLTGDAFLGSSLTVSGTLSPGDNPGTVTAASLTLLDGSTTVMDVVSSGAAGTAYDTIVVTTSGSLTYDGNLRVAFSASSPFADDTTFSLFDFSGSTSGTFDTITTIGSGIYAGLTFTKNTVDGNWYSGDTLSGQFLKFSPSTGNLVVVPEPSTWVAAVVGIAFAARFARRRRPA